jgi:hypothetical protein
MGRARCQMRGRRARWAAAAILAAASASCTLLSPRALCIIRWSPSSAQPDPSQLSTWVEFSTAVDATAAEQAFSLTEDGSPMKGSFSWDGNRLVFEPLAPFSAGKDYTMSVADSVEDVHGVSLDREFTCRFSTKSERTRPRILAVSPSAGASIDDRHAPITIAFSEPIDAASFLRAFGVSPPVPGSIMWSADGMTASFAPAAPYLWQTEYAVSVGDAASDVNGNRLAEARSWRFTVGSDRQPPLVVELRNAEAGRPGGVVLAPEDPAVPGLTVTPGFECAWGFTLFLSEEVTWESLSSCIMLEPGSALEIAPLPDEEYAFLLSPGERLAWDTVHTLTIRRGLQDAQGNTTAEEAVYHFLTNGPGSRPPRVVKVRFRGTPLAEPAEPADYDPSIPFAALVVEAGSFPVGTTVSSWFDLQVSLAEGAGIDFISALEHFTIEETGGCMSMRATALQTAGFDDPQPEAIAGAVPLRFHVAIVNAAESGTVSLGFSKGFADSRGNPIQTAWRLPFLK